MRVLHFRQKNMSVACRRGGATSGTPDAEHGGEEAEKRRWGKRRRRRRRRRMRMRRRRRMRRMRRMRRKRRRARRRTACSSSTFPRVAAFIASAA